MQVELLAEAETLGEVRPRRRAGHHDEAVWIRERQRPEQDGIDDAEHPDHRADGKSEGGDGGDEKARRAYERPPAVTEVRNPLHDHRPSQGLSDSTEKGPQRFADLSVFGGLREKQCPAHPRATPVAREQSV